MSHQKYLQPVLDLFNFFLKKTPDLQARIFNILNQKKIIFEILDRSVWLVCSMESDRMTIHTQFKNQNSPSKNELSFDLKLSGNLQDWIRVLKIKKLNNIQIQGDLGIAQAIQNNILNSLQTFDLYQEVFSPLFSHYLPDYSIYALSQITQHVWNRVAPIADNMIHSSLSYYQERQITHAWRFEGRL